MPLAACAATVPEREPRILLSSQDLPRMRKAAVQTVLARRVEKALTAGPWSVTYHRPEFATPTPNDYYSEGPYWWPDPENPGGPYIRKDGEVNPGRFNDNHRDIAQMSEAVLTLGMGAALLGDRAAAKRAEAVLKTWFSDPITRMNPHLEYGQAVTGHNTGRGTGIIDTVVLIHCVQGIALIEASGREVPTGVRTWFAQYLKWMTTSPKGLEEKRSGNNHATWWTAQVVAYATLARDDANRRMAWEHFRTFLTPSQIQPDGSCPLEEARTKSLSYSAMNLDGFAVLCRIAQMNGVDLWRFRAPNGAGVEKAFHYLLPYLKEPALWRKQQITDFDPRQVIFPGLAGLGLNSRELLDVYRGVRHPDAPWPLLVDLLVNA